MASASYIIGIDFGTTNCTLSSILLHKEETAPQIEQLPILQQINDQESAKSFSLPSFIYFPMNEENQSTTDQIPWNNHHSFVIGTFARDRGSEIPTRMIHSAKSWLSHSGIDQRKKMLPVESEETFNRMSPLDACVEILCHLRHAWDEEKPNALFVNQEVLITVPASFDPGARQLIWEAAEKAGYPEVILLEEPQAAFYSWISCHPNWRDQLKVGDSILVIDIGGGTTDFTLIVVEEEKGNLILKRQAVGSHLLLGGDNIDLGLAYMAKQKLEDQGHHIDPWQLQALIHQCRQVKEKFLGENPPPEIDLTVLGRGSRLIGNTLKVGLSKEEVYRLILDGFIPLVGPEAHSFTERRLGIQQIGLPYVQDPRISCQLAKFLSMTGESDAQQMDYFILPSAVLFNGGTLKAEAIRKRLLGLLNNWAQILNKPPIKELDGMDYDYAVSKGAAFYGFARHGHALRIRSGTSRSYFVGVEESLPAVPGINPALRAVCIVPFGLEEGEERDLENQEFSLMLGEQASFRFFSHAAPKLLNGHEAIVGHVIKNWKQELTELHPIETTLDKAPDEGKMVHVKLKSRVTELGMLELWCVALDGRKWKLEFNIRD